jgi:hypothetical protein
MAGHSETSAGPRGDGTFPPDWGRPPGTRWSEERALWITANVAKPGRSARAALRRANEERMRDVRETLQGLLAKRDRRA